MSAPILWIVIPILVAVALWFIRDEQLITALSATVVCLVLAALAWLFPIGSLIRIGPITTEITSTLLVFGRRFVLQDADRLALIFFYTLGAFWFFGEGILRRNRLFVPFGLAMLGLAIAAVAVDPFLYAALILEIIVLISIPVVSAAGKPAGQGVLRYLIFQTFGMALILLAGWAAGGVEANPNDAQLTSQALTFLGLGFVFWLAVFPFHSWIPLMLEETGPYRTGFLFSLLPQAMLLLGLDFLNGFAWLRNFPGLPNVLQLTGVIMIAAGGIWAAFQRNLARLLGFALIMETGYALLALSMQTRVGYELYAAMFLPRVVALLVFSMAISSLRTMNFAFSNFTGVLKKHPVEALSILIALFSLGGLPLLAGFPLRQVLLENLAEKSMPVLIWSLAGSTGFMLACIRTLLVFVSAGEIRWQLPNDWRTAVLLLVGVLALVLIGVVPPWFISSMKSLLAAFQNLT